jgi:dolichol-phosphate mannosyltransferase
MIDFSQHAGGGHVPPSPDRNPTLSVVVPVHNEEGNVLPLIAELRSALDGLTTYELVFVDDGSDDATAERLETAARERPPGSNGATRVLRHRTGCGQSTALHTGVLHARGALVATMDGDGQNDPADIPPLLARLTDPQRPSRLVMVAGWRTTRRDDWVVRLSSRVANAVRGRLLGDRTPDTGCGLKLFERETFLRLPYFDHMHRFLPALVRRAGGEVESIPVHHRRRVHGRSHYGLHNRLWTGIVDLAGVIWLTRRARLPQLVVEGAAAPDPASLDLPVDAMAGAAVATGAAGAAGVTIGCREDLR